MVFLTDKYSEQIEIYLAALRQPVPVFLIDYKYRVIINDCSRRKPCPCSEMFAALYKHGVDCQ
jgi:hypothetical protein